MLPQITSCRVNYKVIRLQRFSKIAIAPSMYCPERAHHILPIHPELGACSPDRTGVKVNDLSRRRTHSPPLTRPSRPSFRGRMRTADGRDVWVEATSLLAVRAMPGAGPPSL